MGLDGVELLLEVEGRFGIAISDDEAISALTVQDLTNIVMSRIAARQGVVCPTAHAFMSLRSDLRRMLSQPALRVRPRQNVDELLSVPQRRKLWRHLQDELGTAPPGLQRPRFVKIALLLAILLIFGAAMLIGTYDVFFLPISVLGAAFFALSSFYVTLPLCVVPPASMATFGDLARKVAGRTMTVGRPTDDVDAWLVPEVLRDMIAKQLHIDRSIVVPAARFVEDLGI